MRLGWLLLLVGCQAAVGKSGPDPGDRCQAACQEAFDRSPRGTSSCGPTVESCSVTCAGRLGPAGPACGQCILDQIDRQPGYCNERECLCDRLSVGSYDTCLPACTAEKAAADAQATADAEARLRGPRPRDVGRPPELLVEVPALESVHDAALDAEGALWTLGWPAGQPGNGDGRPQLTVLDRDFALRRTDDFAELRPAGAGALALPGDGTAWISANGDKSAVLARLGAGGPAVQLRSDVDPGPYYARTRLRVLPDNRLLRVGGNLGLSVLDGSGGLVWQGDPPGVVKDGAAIDAAEVAGDWVVVQSNGAITVKKLRLLRDETGTRRLEELWRRQVQGTGLSSFPRALALTPSGDAVVVGELGAGSIRTPFVARIDRDGEHLWTWTAPDRPLIGEFVAVAVDRAGDIVAVGHLDRVEAQPHPPDSPICPPEKTWCSSLYVVELRGDGTFEWEYQHRSHHSLANAVLIDDQDRPVVLGPIDRPAVWNGSRGGVPILSVLRFAR